MIASDLDGTLVPPGPGPASGTAAFRRRLEAAPEVALAYVTGRHLALALEGIRGAELPVPDFLVGDVGTTVHERDGRRWHVDEGYRARMRARLGDTSIHEVRSRLARLDLKLQAPDRQAEFKLSFTFEADRAETDVAAEVADAVAGLPVRAVVSREPDTGQGLLDLLPENVAKDTAVRHLRDRLGLRDDDVLFAGDSGNDRDALLGGWLAVLVGNAPDDLRAELRAEATRRGLANRLHLARAPITAGVLEACDRFGILKPDPR